MYVCLCNQITDKEILQKKDEVKASCQSLQECCEKLNIGTKCGICKRDALNFLSEERNNHSNK